MEYGYHKEMISAARNNKDCRLDILVGFKAMVRSSTLAISSLVEDGIVFCLLQIMSDFKTTLDPILSMYNCREPFFDLPMLGLAIEVLGTILETGFVKEDSDVNIF